VWTQAKLDAEVKKGTIINLSSKFGFNVLRSDQTDKIKRPSTLIDNKVKVGTNEDAYNESIQLFKNEGIMNYPKPVSLITFLINSITYFDKDAIILDFFSGSATTAHAVMQLNAEDGGNRKFIMVQLPEETDPKSEAYKAGYKNICEIGKERIRRAGKKIEEELKAKSTKGDLFEGDKEVKMVDTGFRVLKVDSTNMKDVFYSPSQYNQQMLLDLESNIKDDRTDIDLLYGVLLEWGVPLSLPHITEKIGGKDVHFVNDTDLVACFEEHVPEEVIREIARRKPLRVVFRDSSFRNSPDKINVTEIFKTLSPETTIKVI
jgi:adenine-specific DNA-methyltransferase